MSDTSNLASNNIEPSMEDILSSIRKVIAEDLSKKEADDNQPEASTDAANVSADEPIEAVTDTDELSSVEQIAPAEAALGDILELNDLLGDTTETNDDINEVMELIQLDDDTQEISKPEQIQALEVLEVPSPVLPDTDTDTDPVVESFVAVNSGEDIDFDETLDLVMDSDASDYVTESFTPVTDTPYEEAVEAPVTHETAAAYDGPKVDIVDNLFFEESNDAGFEAVTSAEEETPIAPEIAAEIAQEPEPTREPAQASENQASQNDDMDLVKSLLEDLMDEPVSESVEAAVAETAISVEDNFSEDDLLIPDPETGHSEVTEELIQTSTIDEQDFTETPEEVEVEDLFDALAVEAPTPTDVELENEIESELAQIAREIAEARDASIKNAPAHDDVVELSTPDYASKLAVTASLAGGAAVAQEKSKGIIAAAAEDDLESLQQLIAEADLEKTTPEAVEATDEIEMLTSPIQEDETMATPKRSDVLSDADTQQEVGNAFASLTTTVQEHALAEENGPPIGELVKEALRPMLQEWLDKNLKAMVQRAVTKEIKRISSGK